MEPSVRIVLESCQSAGLADRWVIAWRVHNAGDEPIRIEDAWIPHGRFRGEGHVPLDVLIGPGQSTRVELGVSATEEPGTVVENAFLILRTDAARIFTRMRIEFDDDCAPRPIIERITAQPLS